MPHGSVWWYPNYIEYGSGLNPPRTWPNVMEQYRRPDSIKDLRRYDLPTTESMDALYFRYPRLLPPKYRGLFRDKPHCVPRYYPEGMDLPEGKPKGFHGRMYYEDGPPQFKYQGRKVDDLKFLEMPPYLPNTVQAYQTYDPCRLDTSRVPNSLEQCLERNSAPVNLPHLPSPPSYSHSASASLPSTCALRSSETCYDNRNHKVHHLSTVHSALNNNPQRISMNGLQA